MSDWNLTSLQSSGINKICVHSVHSFGATVPAISTHQKPVAKLPIFQTFPFFMPSNRVWPSEFIIPICWTLSNVAGSHPSHVFWGWIWSSSVFGATTLARFPTHLGQNPEKRGSFMAASHFANSSGDDNLRRWSHGLRHWEVPDINDVTSGQMMIDYLYRTN